MRQGAQLRQNYVFRRSSIVRVLQAQQHALPGCRPGDKGTGPHLSKFEATSSMK